MTELKPLTVEEFRSAYPLFTAELYPDAAVQIRLTLANEFFDDPPWKAPDVRAHAMGLFTAHFLSIQGSAANGGSGRGGGISGLVSGKSVDGASVSYDTTTGAFADAGFWNLTPYGQELWWLMLQFGAGAFQL